MVKLTGGQALVKSILKNEIDTIFGLPGVQLDWFFNALYDEGDNVRVFNSRHEQGVAYMATGYAQSTGRIGTYAVVPGPGVLNTTAALSTAYAINAPVLCITGQIPSTYIGRGLGQLHEIPDQLGILERLTKWSSRITHATDVPGKVSEAVRQLTQGRTGPVALEMPLDLLAQKGEVHLSDKIDITPAPILDAEAVDRAAEMLLGANYPLICVGGGVIGAEEELRSLAEFLQAPVIANRNGRGALDDRHYLSHSMVGGYRIWPKADVVLAIGSRLQPQRMIWGTDEHISIIHVDIDPTELKRVSNPKLGIVADSKQFLSCLLRAVSTQSEGRPSREDEMLELKSVVTKTLHETVGPQMAWISAIRDVLNDDGILVDELTQIGYVCRLGLPVYSSRTFLTTGYQGTLGAGYAIALGAQIANPEKQVLSINGDGGFMYNVQELATAAKYKVPVVAVVFKDGAFGNVRRMQKNFYDNRIIASDLTNPDFVKLAESFGVEGHRASSPAELRICLSRAFESGNPAVIEVPLKEMPDPWKLIYPGPNRPQTISNKDIGN